MQFKTFYIPHHKMSYYAALAAGCAQEQDKYIEYHNTLFEHQENITNSSLRNFAVRVGIDLNKFEECIEAEKYKEEVNADSLAGIHAGVVGTPTFFINKQKIVGPKPFRTFKTIIDEELEK